MENHILFFILAALLIAVLVGYSLYSARREKSRVFSNTFSTRSATPINSESHNHIPPSLNPQANTMQPEAPQDAMTAPWATQAEQQEVVESVNKIKISLQTQPEFSQPSPISEPLANVQPTNVQHQPEVQAAENAMVMLYVVAPEGHQFFGEQVVQALDSVGLKFGEYEIFHRHLDNPTSPVLFSAANMMQPGKFDLANIDRLAMTGLVFFMQLPSIGNDLANLRIMISTAESFAQVVGGILLNDQFQIFDDVSRQQYLLRIIQH